MLLCKFNYRIQFLHRYIGRQLQKDRSVETLLVALERRQHVSQNLRRHAAPVYRIIIRIGTESLVQICNVCHGPLRIGRSIGIDIHSQNVFSVPFPLQIFQDNLFSGIIEART